MVYGLDAARLVSYMFLIIISPLILATSKTWHMLPNVLIDALGEESASELVDALLKQHEAEQRLRHSSGSCVNTFSSSSSSAESQTDFQLEVVRRMIDRAEKELSFLKKAAVVVLN